MPAPPIRFGHRALLLGTLPPLVGAALAATAPLLPPRLPACDARITIEQLAERIDDIPALAERDARLIGLEDTRRRGHAGSRRLRACQGTLVTSAGRGPIEYSIRLDDGRVTVRPELFRGGWRTHRSQAGAAS